MQFSKVSFGFGCPSRTSALLSFNQPSLDFTNIYLRVEFFGGVMTCGQCGPNRDNERGNHPSSEIKVDHVDFISEGIG